MTAPMTGNGNKYDACESYDSILAPLGVGGMSTFATANEPWRIGDVPGPEASVSGATPGLRFLMTGAVVFITTVAPGLHGGGAGVAEVARTPDRAPVEATRLPPVPYAVPLRRRREDDDAASSVASDVAVTAGEQALAVRSTLGLSVTEISRLLRVSRATVHAWIRGDVAAPQDPSVKHRLFELHQMAQQWKRDVGARLGGLVRAAVAADGATLLSLLGASEWDRPAIDQTLQVLASAVISAESAQARQHPMLTGTVDSTPEEVAAVERGRNRRALQRVRALRRRG